MNHPAELKIHKFIQDVMNGDATMEPEVQERVVQDVKDALAKQFELGSRNKEFTLRMSNAGKAHCQLWYGKNKPEVAAARSPNFLMNMMIGDIVEAVFKGLLTSAGVEFQDGEHLTLEVGDYKINGTPDMTMDGKVDDIKSASPYAYQHKFESFETLSREDPFGYISQLVGYAEALDMEAGGWWVINKATGEFKYVDASELREEKRFKAELKAIENKAIDLEKNVFYRCYVDEPELFRRKPTGNRKLGHACSWCDYKRDCWPEAKHLPSIPSTAKEPPMVWYTHIEEQS